MNAAVLVSHVSYIKTLSCDWTTGLTKAQRAATDAGSHAQEAITVAQALCSNVTDLSGQMSQGRGMAFYRQMFGSHDGIVAFVTSNNIGLGCTGNAFLLMHGDALVSYQMNSP
jgi:hypothetical protein